MGVGLDLDIGYGVCGESGYLNTESGVKALIKAAKALLKGLSLGGVIDVKSEGHWQRTYEVLDISKQVVTGLEAPDKLQELWSSLVQVVTPDGDNHSPLWERLRDLVAYTTNLWNSVQELLEVIFINMTPEQAMLLEQIGGVALGVGMGCLLQKDVTSISKKMTKLQALRGQLEDARKDGSEEVATLEKFIAGLETQRDNTMIRVAQWVSYAALAVLVCAVSFGFVAASAAVAGATIGTWMFACTTSALFFSIFAHFHAIHVVDPIFTQVAEDPTKGMTHAQLVRYATQVGKLPGHADERRKAVLRDHSLETGSK